MIPFNLYLTLLIGLSSICFSCNIGWVSQAKSESKFYADDGIAEQPRGSFEDIAIDQATAQLIHSGHLCAIRDELNRTHRLLYDKKLSLAEAEMMQTAIGDLFAPGDRFFILRDQGRAYVERTDFTLEDLLEELPKQITYGQTYAKLDGSEPASKEVNGLINRARVLNHVFYREINQGNQQVKSQLREQFVDPRRRELAYGSHLFTRVLPFLQLPDGHCTCLHKNQIDIPQS